LLYNRHMVEWNRVTWYSKLLAVILFIAVIPAWTFYIGTQYEKTALVLEEGNLSPFVAPKISPTTTPEALSGVEGTVTLGPTCPVMMNPPDPQCADKPYETTLVISSTQSGKSSLVVKTDATGHYKALLAPGTYIVSAQSGATLPRLQPINFLVRNGMMTELNFSFDSGIR
jgi:hypothetical protein